MDMENLEAKNINQDTYCSVYINRIYITLIILERS